jgi:hypothetical protein
MAMSQSALPLQLNAGRHQWNVSCDARNRFKTQRSASRRPQIEITAQRTVIAQFDRVKLQGIGWGRICCKRILGSPWLGGSGTGLASAAHAHVALLSPSSRSDRSVILDAVTESFTEIDPIRTSGWAGGVYGLMQPKVKPHY